MYVDPQMAGANPVISTKIRLEADGIGDIKAATIRAVEAGPEAEVGARGGLARAVGEAERLHVVAERAERHRVVLGEHRGGRAARDRLDARCPPPLGGRIARP